MFLIAKRMGIKNNKFMSGYQKNVAENYNFGCWTFSTSTRVSNRCIPLSLLPWWIVSDETRPRHILPSDETCRSRSADRCRPDDIFRRKNTKTLIYTTRPSSVPRTQSRHLVTVSCRRRRAGPYAFCHYSRRFSADGRENDIRSTRQAQTTRVARPGRPPHDNIDFIRALFRMPTAGRPHHAHDTPATAAMDASASGGGDIRSAADGAEVTAAVTVRIETGRRPADYPAPSSGRKRGVACTCQTSGPTPAKRRRLGLDEMTAWEACWAAGPAEGTRSRTAARARLAAAAAQETAASTSLSSSPPLQLTTPGSPSPRMLQPMPGPSSPSTPPILQPATSSPTPPPQLAPSTSTPSSPTTLKMRNLPVNN